MATLKLEWKDLPRELRRLPRRQQAAVRRGVAEAISVDSYRWIQWAIRGGGIAGPKQPRPPPKPREPEGEKERPSLVRRVLSALGKLMGMIRGARTAKVAPPKLKRPKKVKKVDPCARREAPAYRVPIDTGDYARSWAHVIRPDGSGMVYSTASPAVKAGVIEKGRRAKHIPKRELAEWVRRKFGCQDPKKAMRIATAISFAASKQPREGLNVLGRAHPKIAEAAAKNIRKYMRMLRPGT